MARVKKLSGAEIFSQLDQYIKLGQGDMTRAYLLEMKLSSIDRELKADFAKLALRVGLPQKAYSILKPVASKQKDKIDKLSDEEKLQFGMALKQLGAIDYAKRIFEQIQSEAIPEAHLYQAIVRFSNWEYQQAITYLLKFVEFQSLNDNQVMIGHLNLASAYIFLDQFDAAQKSIDLVMILAKKLKHNLVLGNVLELQAQIYVNQSKIEQAEAVLVQARELIQDKNSVYSLFVDKWAAINEVIKQRQSQNSLIVLNAVRERALLLKHWESVRDIDFYFCTLKKDPKLFWRVYCGTPFESYRQRLLKRNPFMGPTPDFYDWFGPWKIEDVDISKVPTIDFTWPEISIGDDQIKSKSLLWNVLQGLCYDLYAPVKPVSLYFRLFPDEKVEPEEAVQRIFNAVSKINSLFEKCSWPLKIISLDEGYRFEFKSPVLFRIPLNLSFQGRQDSIRQLLQEKFSELAFSASEACDHLNISRRSLNRYLADAVDRNEMAKLGSGSQIKYKVVK